VAACKIEHCRLVVQRLCLNSRLLRGLSHPTVFPLSNYAHQDLAAYSFFITLFEVFGLCRNIAG